MNRYRSGLSLIIGLFVLLLANVQAADSIATRLSPLNENKYEILVNPRLDIALVGIQKKDGTVPTVEAILENEDFIVTFPEAFNDTIVFRFAVTVDGNTVDRLSEEFPISRGVYTPGTRLEPVADGDEEPKRIEIQFGNGQGRISDSIEKLSYKALEWLDPRDNKFKVADRRPSTPLSTLVGQVVKPTAAFAGMGGILGGTKLRLVFTDGGTIYQSQEFAYADFADADGTETDGAEIIDDEPEMFAAGSSRTSLYRQLKTFLADSDISENTFKDLVVNSAESHQFHPSGNAFIFRYDRRPYDTAKKIADILRKTAEDLKTKTIEQATADMNTKFEAFYESGENPYSDRNPYVDDWQPFLKKLRDEVTLKIEGLSLANSKALWAFVLISLADGFDEIVVRIESTIDGENPPAAFGNSGGTFSGGTTTRERRRIKCWNLLFGL
jgi:hypothetical protein